MTALPNRLPPIGLLRRYLHSTGWKSTYLKGGLLELFTLGRSEESMVEVILPKSRDVPDADKRLSLALQTLSDLLLIPVSEVALKISALDYDVIRAILPDSVVERDGVSLSLAERFIGDLRRLFVSTATAQITGARVFNKAIAQASDFARRCRLGHTFPGSFGFTLEAPIGPYPSTEPFDTAPPPVERRITERLANGLQSIQLAEAVGDASILFDRLESGFNGNMLEDISSMLQRTEAPNIAFDVLFSDAWATRLDARMPAIITTAAIPLIDDVVKNLRNIEPKGPERVFGTVYRLESHETPREIFDVSAQREIAIDVKAGEWSGLTMRAKITPDEYLQALDAHEHGRLVTLVGRVERTRRGYAIQEISEFSVVAYS